MSGIPLVWRFAERIEVEQIEIGMFYDPEKKMNCIKVNDENLPLVQAQSTTLGTMTVTEVKREETDRIPAL